MIRKFVVISMKLKTKLQKYFQKGDIWMTIILVIAILGVVNFLSYQIFIRWDVTENNIYSISDSTKKTLKELDDIVNIKVYFSDNLPNRYLSLAQKTRDTLSEYEIYSEDKVKVSYINPKEMEDHRQRLAMLGIPALQFNVLKEGSYEVVQGYMGISVQYGDENEAIPAVGSIEDLEYQLTMAIKKVTQEDLTTIGLLSDHGAVFADEEIAGAKEALSDIYNIKEVSLEEGQEIPSDISTLIILGPTEEFKRKELEVLDSYVMSGGNIFLLADGVDIDARMQPRENNIGLNGLLEEYGVRIKNNLVVDKNCGQAAFSSGWGSFMISYPLWPKVEKNNFNPDLPATQDLEALVLPWASELEILKQENAQYLAKSSSDSWTQSDPFNLDPTGDFISPGGGGEHILAVLINKTINSAYSEKSTDKGRVAVVGDSDFIKERFLQQTGRGEAGANLIFFQNVVDSLSLDESLIKIRSKDVSDRPLTSLSDEQKRMIKYANILVLPIAVVVLGMIRYYLRKREITWRQLLRVNKK
jgi:gliding-associated putative ABC transporter substrate-binding component GldG